MIALRASDALGLVAASLTLTSAVMWTRAVAALPEPAPGRGTVAVTLQDEPLPGRGVRIVHPDYLRPGSGMSGTLATAEASAEPRPWVDPRPVFQKRAER